MHRGMKAQSTFATRQGRRQMGDVISDIANVASGGLGGGASSVVDSLAGLFGGGLSSTDEERAEAVYTLYEEAMTSPGSNASMAAVVALYTISSQIFDPVNQVNRNNPAITRSYAATALQKLATQGWTNVQSLTPRYTGVAASGQVLDAQGNYVGTNPLPGSFSLGTLLLFGAGAFVVYKIVRD
jgi:hypothetical protein